ncbi:MAG: response regulator [Chitinophagaceae bacterium]
MKKQLYVVQKARKKAESALGKKTRELDLAHRQLLQIQRPAGRHATVFNNIPADIALFSPEHEYLFLNNHAEKEAALRQWVIGETEEEYCRVSGKGLAVAIRRIYYFSEAVKTKQPQEWEEKVRDNKGKLTYRLLRLHPVSHRKGGLNAVIRVGFDITAKKIEEDQLLQTAKHHLELFNHCEALICIHDLKGRLLSVNPATCRCMEYSEDELTGRFIYDFMPENRRNEFKHVYLPAIRQNKTAGGVLSILSKTGRKIFMLFQNAVVDVEGAEPYVIGFSLDITERIYAEQHLLYSKKVTEQASHAKETFLANMSHEIRTPINGILGISGLLSKTPLNELQRNYLQLIQESSNNLLVISNDVLDMEKIISGKMQLEQLGFKIVDKIAINIQSFIYRAEEKGVAIIFQNTIPADLVVTGDPFRLSQVLNNILSNAIKFTEKGNIIITTRIRSYYECTTIIECIVKDTGIGISENRIDEIFEPFVQADPSTSRKYGGTGLGLAICKNLLEMLGGSLQVESVESKGSTFTFSIPYTLTEGNASEPEPPVVIDYLSLGNKKVLVAEDGELNQFIVKHMLESWGFEVSVAADGMEALRMIQENSYDLVLMDVQMPVMDGLTTTRRIRQLNDQTKAGIPIIALTANVSKGDSENYIEAGMNDYLSKPVNEAKLFKAIEKNFKGTNTKPIDMNEILTGATESFHNQRLYDLSTIIAVSGGDEEFVKKMVKLFIETVPANLQELNAYLNTRNWDMVSKMAHKLKSTLDSMGIDSLRQDVRTVEASAKRNENLENLPALIYKINVVIKNCIAQLENEVLALN